VYESQEFDEHFISPAFDVFQTLRANNVHLLNTANNLFYGRRRNGRPGFHGFPSIPVGLRKILDKPLNPVSG